MQVNHIAIRGRFVIDDAESDRRILNLSWIAIQIIGACDVELEMAAEFDSTRVGIVKIVCRFENEDVGT